MLWSMLALMAGAVVAAIALHRGRVAWVIVAAPVLWGLARWFLPPRLPPDIRERVVKWKAFRRFLKRFSSLPDAPAMAVQIWEKYLVDATALGVAERVARQVKALIPQRALPSPWEGAPPGAQGLSWLSSISTEMPVAVSLSGSSSPSGGAAWTGSSGDSSSGGGSGGGF